MASPRKRLESHISRYNVYRKKNDRLYNKGLISSKDIELVYEVVFFRSFIEFEVFLEEQFIHLLCGNRLANNRKAKPVHVFQSKKLARQIIYSGRNYIDWLPYDRTVTMAKSFFRDGMPFSGLERVDKQLLERMRVIRNYIAHKSSHTRKLLENAINFPEHLRPSQKRPAGYLRSSFSQSMTQCESEMGNLVRIGRELDSFSE